MKRAALGGLTCACGLLIGWFTRGSGDLAHVQTDAIVRPNPAEQPSASESTVRVELHEPAPPPIREALQILDEALSANPAPTGTDAPYLTKYLDATDDQLLIARFAIERKVISERARISKELIDAGGLETILVPAGGKPPPMESDSGSPVSSFAFSMKPNEDGSAEYSRAKIKLESYPEFHALEMEWWWLESYTTHKGIKKQ